MASSADVVVGIGAVGGAVAYHLAAAGAKVVGIDHFMPPREHGCHSATRITRLGIGKGHEHDPSVSARTPGGLSWRRRPAGMGTNAGDIAAAHVVLATGAWSPAMLPAAVHDDSSSFLPRSPRSALRQANRSGACR